MQTLPGSASTTAGSAAGAPSSLLLFICPGSKVLIEQPGLLQVHWHGGFGLPGGLLSRNGPVPCAAAPRPDPGRRRVMQLQCRDYL